MCYVIITVRTLVWFLMTLVATLAIVTALLTPKWLVGPLRRPGLRSSQLDVTEEVKYSIKDEENLYSPSLGLYTRCTRVHDYRRRFPEQCGPFVTSFGMDSDDFPNTWKAAVIFFATGLILMVFTVIASVLGCCFRSICKKSLFTISGTIQSVAGLLYILALVLYPTGWGSRRVHLVCGDNTGPFIIGDCSLGWAFYIAMAGTFATFICSVLSIQADVSTSSDRVQNEILEGKNLICVL